MSEYLLGSSGTLLYSIETTSYTEETDIADFDELGYTTDDFDPSNENPHTPLPTGGVDGPYINSPDPREHSFDPTIVPVDDRVPLELAFGAVEEDNNTTVGYAYSKYTVDRPLPTATLLHRQEDADLQVPYIGAKASVTFSWSQGDPLNCDFSFTAAKQGTPTTVDAYTTGLPEDTQPFRSEMQGVVTIDDGNGFSREIATVTGGEVGIDNGLEVNHHGQPSGSEGDVEAGREAYSVSEETNAERFTEHTLEVKPTDDVLYRRAAENDVPINYEIPFIRGYNDTEGAIDDGLIIRGFDTPVVDFPMPYQAEGSLETTMTLQPTSFEVEIREPV
jgi:hypothetical protein